MSTLSMLIDINTRANQRELNSLRNSFQSLTQSAKQLAGISIGQNFIQEIRQANTEFQSFERSLNAIKGVGAGTLEFSRLAGLADKLGLSINSLSQSYKTFNASATGTSLEGFKAAQGFEALAGALSVVGASSDQSRRAFTAVSQMISKGQVYAEELKQQLAENLPGAIGIFARAMNVSQGELLALVKAGKVGLPQLELFFNQLSKETGKAAASLSNPTLQQATERLKTQFDLLFIQLGQGGVWQALTANVNTATNVLRSFTTATDGGLSTVQSSFIAVQQTIVSWGNTFQQTFQEADTALNGFVSHFGNQLGDSGLDLGALILRSMADLPANLKALVTIIVGELGKGAIEIGRLFDQQWLNTKVSAESAFLGIRVAFQTVVSGIQTMLGTLAGSMADSLDTLGKSGEFIPGFKTSINDVAQGLRAVESGAVAGAAKLELLKSKQNNLKQSYEDSRKAIDDTARSYKDAWDDVIQGAIEAANATSKQRRELTEQLQYYKQIDQAEQKLWSLRMENIRATNLQTNSVKSLNGNLKSSVEIVKQLKGVNDSIKAIEYQGESGQRQAVLDSYLEIRKVQEARQRISEATTAQEKEAAAAAYAATLKETLATVGQIKSDKERLAALRLLAVEKSRLAELGIEEDKSTSVKVDADTSKAKETFEFLKTEIEGVTTFTQVDAATENARKSVNSLIQWANSQSATIRINTVRTSQGEGSIEGFHNGGVLSGYGGGDRVRALLEPGEAVLTKEVVRALGANTINAMNAMRGKAISIPKVNPVSRVHIPKLASGGVVSPSYDHYIHIGKDVHKVGGDRDAVAGLVKSINKIGRAI